MSSWLAFVIGWADLYQPITKACGLTAEACRPIRSYKTAVSNSSSTDSVHALIYRWGEEKDNSRHDDPVERAPH